MRCLYCGSEAQDAICATCGELVLESSPATFIPALPAKEGISDHIRKSGSLLIVLSSPKSMRTESFSQSILDNTFSDEEKLKAYGSLLKEMGISDDVCSLRRYPFLSSEEREVLSQILRLDIAKMKKHRDETLIRIGNLHFLLAKGLGGLGEWATTRKNEHLETASKAYLLLKSDIIAKRNLGLVYLESEEDEEAMEYIDAALKELRKDAELWAAKGILLHRSEKPSESLKCLNRAVKLRENDPRIWTTRGRLLADMSRLEDALDSFDEAIVRDRAFIPAWREKMDVLLRLGSKREATQVSETIQEMIGTREDPQLESEPLEPIEIVEAKPIADEPAEDGERGREELMDFLLQIEGIGESKAEMIFAHGIDSLKGLRKTTLEDLVRVRGISEKIAQSIKDRIEGDLALKELEGSVRGEGAEEAMEIARVHLEEGDYERALAYYDSRVEMNPENEEAWFNMGEVLQALGRTREAIEAYDRVISIDEGKIEAWMEKANILLEIGKPLDAVECYKIVLDMDPENTNYLVERAKILAEDENHEAAILCYDIVLERDPENFDANLGMVFSLLHLGDLDRAEKCLNTVAKLTSLNEKVWWARGHLMDKRGRWGAAIQFYNRAISLKWNYPDPWIGKGEILLRQKNYREAKKCFEKVLEMNAKRADAWLGKAKALDGMGQKARALEWLDDFLQIYPNHAKALEMRDHLRSENTEDYQSFLHEARIQRELGDFERAADTIVKAIKENPDEESGWTLLGDILLDTADSKGMLERLEVELSAIASSAGALTSKGAVYLRVGEYGDALKCFDIALSMDKNHERARRLKKRCYVEMGKVK